MGCLGWGWGVGWGVGWGDNVDYEVVWCGSYTDSTKLYHTKLL